MSSAATEDLAPPSTSPSSPPPFYDLSSNECDGDEYLPKGTNDQSSSSDEDSDSDSELDFDSRQESSLDLDDLLSIFEAKVGEQSNPEMPLFTWQRENNKPQVFGFSGCFGVNVDDLHQRSTPFEIYSHFVTPKLMDHLVRETNRYYHQDPAPTPSTRKWHDTSREELHAYFGLWLLMDLLPKPDMKVYWLDPLFAQPIFPETMQIERFVELTQNLHAVDNSGVHPADDRLWKLRPVIDMLNQQFLSVYTPPQRITVNESVWMFRSYLGVKVYKLCVSDGATAGYTSTFQIYAGQDKSEFPLSMKAIINLMDAADLFGKGYELYTNILHTSPTLFHYLQNRYTSAVGIVRTNCKYMPSDLQAKKRGEVDYRSTPTGLFCLQWLNKEPITMLSTVHDSEMVTSTSRYRTELQKPRVVSDYNARIKGLEMKDQIVRSYRTVRKSMSWYKKMILYLIDAAVVNTFCVHKALGGTLNLFDFKSQLIRELIQEFTCPKRGAYQSQEHPPTASVERRLQGMTTHHQQQVPEKKYRRCKMCRQNGKRKMTKTMCSDCKVSLCQYDCFHQWHAQQ
ncbi:piggyBac transposable element-derived protein 4-like isoform X2 [Penaeus japonicus]|uniref:piggyBac transposable element-derived protein 4-like isoform X2 n=1 Tax=Penaeus japonicus TaxID=27405 RepID=UPI001C71225D|nr:piggyBac transposable element-derived protein 4-like isoform X2 [Penaeus japonicus]